jgi:hypothetical protein
MPAVRVRVLKWFLLGLGVCLLGACLLVWPAIFKDCPASAAIKPDSGGTVRFDLTQVLANVPGDVPVWACVEQKCVWRERRSSNRTIFRVNNAELTEPETVDVRVVVRDNRGVVFDATGLVQLDEWHEWQPNGPDCYPFTQFDARVQATPEGDLIPL